MRLADNSVCGQKASKRFRIDHNRLLPALAQYISCYKKCFRDVTSDLTTENVLQNVASETTGYSNMH